MQEPLLKHFTAEHLPEPLPVDPMPLLTRWFEEAMRDAAPAMPDAMPDAMALATSGSDGAPAVRYVLCKRIEPVGAVRFFTNFESRKSLELAANPRAAGAFYWAKPARQVRLEGSVERLTDQASDAYFATRPLASKVGAWASRQSRPLESREHFARDVISACERLGVDPARLGDPSYDIAVARPANWGGFRLRIQRVEMWCGADGRLHDRAEWVRSAQATAEADGNWAATRLYP